jgi:hypothetical protein
MVDEVAITHEHLRDRVGERDASALRGLLHLVLEDVPQGSGLCVLTTTMDVAPIAGEPVFERGFLHLAAQAARTSRMEHGARARAR